MLGSRIAGIIIGNLYKEDLFPARRIKRSAAINVRGQAYLSAEYPMLVLRWSYQPAWTLCI